MLYDVLPADLNSMFDFAAYNLHGEMMKLEAAGKPAFLRDDRGEVVILCNVRCCPPPAAAWQQVPRDAVHLARGSRRT